MQLVTIECREVAGRPGVITAAGEILDLAAAPTTLAQSQWIPQSVISILAAGEHGRDSVQGLLDAAADADPQTLRAGNVLLAADQTQLMAPVRRPGLVLVQESATGAGGEELPVVSIKSPNTVTGPRQGIRVPWRASEGLSVRPLFGIVLGRPLHRGSEEEAAAAIAAYTLLLDLSRPVPDSDASAASWRRYLDSKQFPGACPLGPAVMTKDDCRDEPEAALTLTVNGIEMAGAHYPLAKAPELLAALSNRFGFRPGDVIGLDLPMGEGDQRKYQDGDHIVLALAGRMELEATLRF